MRRLPASTAALGILASPVIGVITAMIVLGERPTLYDAIGFALMLSASAIVVLRPDGATEAGALAHHKKLCGSTSTSSLMLPFFFGARASHSRR